MSDFISRIAARAVGTPPVARPRLPTFFAEHAAADDVELVQKGVVAPPPAPQTQEVQPSHETSTTTPDQVAVEPLPLGAAEKRSEVVQEAPSEHLLVVERSTTHEREVAQAVHVTQPTATQHELVQQAAQPATVQAMPVVLEAERATAVPAPAAPAEELPSVRVHIGRLEVRANLQQAPPHRPSRAEPRAQELSLSDYLRGKREAG